MGLILNVSSRFPTRTGFSRISVECHADYAISDALI
jgi:hypothetical protein